MTKNWITSPLGIKVLMNLYGKCMRKDFSAYANISEILKNKKEFILESKLFLLPLSNKYTMVEKNNFNVQTAMFKNQEEFVKAIKDWVQQYSCFQQFTLEKNTNEIGFLTNVCMYKGLWRDSGTNVIIHNSFSYTEDVKYEARILIVPTSSEDVMLVIVVPNESDVLSDLTAKLNEEGLAAALNSIQPAFTATSTQMLPMFNFKSSLKLQSSTEQTTTTQYGEVRVDESGVDVKVLTCLPITEEKLSFDYKTPPTSDKSFNFAIVFNDLPLFAGQVMRGYMHTSKPIGSE